MKIFIKASSVINMFYIQNWSDLFPRLSAFEIFNDQLANIEHSIKYFDSSSLIKKDSYLLGEINRVQKLAYLIEEKNKALLLNPRDTDASNFMFQGRIEQLSALQTSLKLFEEVKRRIFAKTDKVGEEYSQRIGKVKEGPYKTLLEKVKKLAIDANNDFGSQSNITCQKVLECFSKYLEPNYDLKIKELEKIGDTESTSEISTLLQEIKNDLRKGEHKLYYCTLDNRLFKKHLDWRYLKDAEHAFVIEKTSDDLFRLYQSYPSQYSLKSFLSSELGRFTDGLRSYVDFYPFLKGLEKLESTKAWNPEINESYTKCFGVDHSTFLGEESVEGLLQMHYCSFVLQPDGYQAPVKEVVVEEPQDPIIEKPEKTLSSEHRFKQVLEEVVIGATLGSVVTVIAWHSIQYLAKILY